MPDLDARESVGAKLAAEIRARLEPRRGEMADLLVELVGIESPTDDPAGLDRMADRLHELFSPFGPIVRHPIGPGGAGHLVLSVDGAAPGADGADGAGDGARFAAVLGHYDTVWPAGSIERLPARVDSAGIATGPGCFDMKGGLVQLYYALAELRRLGRPPRRALRVLFNCDEEVRSRTSRGLIHELAAGAGVAYVLEAPLPGGGLKIARKGAAIYRLEIEGRAAHAGIEPEKGASAIVELAHQIQAVHALGDPARGTTVNVGVVGGGTRPNVVAARAHAEIDVRTATMAEAERVDRAIKTLRPVVPGTRLNPVPDLSRPPMEPTEAGRRLFERARAIAANVGITDLAGGATGGASDANLIAAAGVPTLDGLGPEGGGAHADDEHVLTESMPRRAALIAGLLAEV
ncbi:MAG TPA: M20 family metallopeptidase [Streptosporangiaceae bacterium]|nr:M20 family metallopeptidase [Streptosporangiaceae bacterium]